MQFNFSKRFIRDELPQSPEIDPRTEFIKLAIGELTYADGQVTFKIFISYLFPESLIQRYQTVDEALVIIVNDLNQQDCFATNFKSDAYVPEPGLAMSSNLLAPPPTLSAPDEKELQALSGGWISGELSFATPCTRASVSLYLYVVLENFFSNVVGIDLSEKAVVYY